MSFYLKLQKQTNKKREYHILKVHPVSSFALAFPVYIRLVVNNDCFASQLILGDPGAVSRVHKMSVVKVYCKIETSPWELTLTEKVPEAFELPASDWPEKNQRRGAAG